MKFSFLFVLLCLISSFCFATSISINPTKLIFTPESTVQSIELENLNPESAIFQFEIFEWSQDNGGNDHFEPKNDFIISPEVVTLLSNKPQLIRFAYQDKFQLQAEKSYRLFIREVVSPSNPNEPKLGSDLSLELRVPIFVSKEKNLTRDYNWSINKISPTHAQLQVRNTGGKHLLITELSFLRNNKILYNQDKLFKYVLPGSSVFFDIPPQYATQISSSDLLKLSKN